MTPTEANQILDNVRDGIAIPALSVSRALKVTGDTNYSHKKNNPLIIQAEIDDDWRSVIRYRASQISRSKPC